MAALTSAKSVLRKEIKDILKNISLEERKEQSANVFKKVSSSWTKINKSVIFKPKALLKRLCFDEKSKLYKAIIIFTILFIPYRVIYSCAN